jgi:hypothetical protein
VLLPQDREILSSTEKRIERLESLDDDQIRQGLKDQEISFLLFHVGLSYGERKGQFSLLLRLWKLFSKEQKVFFSDVYRSVTGASLQSLISRMGKQEDQEFESIEDETDDEEFEFRDEFIGQERTSRRKASSNFTPLEEEKFKLLYRKLIRKLHPDANAGEKPPTWMKRFWDSVQKAYNSKDLFSLDRILKLTLLRTNSLDQLTVDEICEAKSWLERIYLCLKPRSAS